MTDRMLLPLGVDFADESLKWISISEDDILAATDNTPVLAERLVFYSWDRRKPMETMRWDS